MKTDYPRHKKGDIMNTHDIITDKFYYGKSSQYKNTIGNQHYHNLFEIYYLEEGSCHYFIDNETYEARAGDIVLVPEGIIHKTVYLDSDAKRRLIYCTQMHIPAPVSRYLTNIGYIYRNKKVSNETLSILNEIEKEWSSPDKFSDNMILCHMHRFFFLLARNPDTEVPSRSTNTYTTATIAYIKENYFEDVTLFENRIIYERKHGVTAAKGECANLQKGKEQLQINHFVFSPFALFFLIKNIESPRIPAARMNHTEEM